MRWCVKVAMRTRSNTHTSFIGFVLIIVQSWILDGFPRTLEQGKMLNDVLTAEGIPLNMIVNLNVPDAIIMQRITCE